MAIPRRLSMNTSLSKIFQEECDSNNELYNQLPVSTFPESPLITKIKREPVDSDWCPNPPPIIKVIEVKKEIIEEPSPELTCPSPPSIKALIKVQEECKNVISPNSPPYLTKIKEEAPEGLDENKDKDNGNFSFSEMALITPIKMEDYSALTDKKINLKSVKRTLCSNRNSPYSKETVLEDESATSSKQARFTPKIMKKRECFHETDEEVLKRRQKQIDFGKNTVGYDNYIKMVSRDDRKAGDPQTPNARRKYSRRGFDGLVRQWRLQLHKYDP